MNYLVSGSIGPFYANGMFDQWVKESSGNKYLLLATHHTKGPGASMQRLQANTTSREVFVAITQDNINNIKSNIQNFDGIYITGGLLDPLTEFIDKYRLRDIISKFIINPDKLYVGSSAGFLVLGHQFHTEMESDAIHLSRFSSDGLGILPENILLEVHYSEENIDNLLHNRIQRTLKEIKKLNIAYAFDGNAAIKVNNVHNFQFELLHGSYHVYRK